MTTPEPAPAATHEMSDDELFAALAEATARCDSASDPASYDAAAATRDDYHDVLADRHGVCPECNAIGGAPHEFFCTHNNPDAGLDE